VARAAAMEWGSRCGSASEKALGEERGTPRDRLPPA
jgi:hypothetical protein